MPALPAVPKVIRIDLFSTSGGNTFVRDRFFLQYSGALSVTDLTTVLGTISSAWNTNMSPSLSNTYTLNSIEGTDLTSQSAAQAIVSANRTGAGAGTALPPSTNMIVKFKTARRYRGGHPRFYLAGMVASNLVAGDTWLAAAQASILTAWQNFIAACVLAPPAGVGTLTHVNVSYFAGFVNKTFPSGRVRPVASPRVTPLVDTIISYSINGNVASQRRRNRQSA